MRKNEWLDPVKRNAYDGLYKATFQTEQKYTLLKSTVLSFRELEYLGIYFYLGSHFSDSFILPFNSRDAVIVSEIKLI